MAKPICKFDCLSKHCFILCLFLTLTFALSSTSIFAVEKYSDDEIFRRYEKRESGKTRIHGGIWRFSIAASPQSLDPHMGVSRQTALVSNLTYSGLLRLAPQMEKIELDAAKSWRQINDYTYEFKLREGIRFHDIPPANGREMTSADVKYSVERMMGKYGNKADFKHSYYFLNRLESIETPDKYTIVFETKEPYAPFIRYIASAWTKIVPKEAVDQFKDLKRNCIGSGPFILKENVRGSRLVFERNSNYFKTGLPYLDATHIRIMPNPNSQLSAYIAGELDYIELHPSQIQKALKSVPDSVFSEYDGIHSWVLRTPPWIKGKVELKPPFNDKRVRQAIAYAIDKKKLLQLSGAGAGQTQAGPIPLSYKPWGLPESEQWEYDPAKAKRLLTEAGYPDGFSCELMTWNHSYMTKPAEVIQQMLKQVGVDVKLKPVNYARYFNKTYRYEYEMALHINLAGYDPSEWLKPYFGKQASFAFYKWSDPELWDLIEKQERVIDPEDRLEMITVIQKKVVDEAMSQSMYTQKRYKLKRPYAHSKTYFHSFSAGIPLETLWMEKH